MNKYQYYGLFLDVHSKNRLMDVLTDTPEYKTLLGKADTIFLDHCTLMHVSQRDEALEELFNKNIGTQHYLVITHIGISDKAMAFKVKKKNNVVKYCKNENPHITIATFNGGKPVDSNSIDKWELLQKPLLIKVTLQRI